MRRGDESLEPADVRAGISEVVDRELRRGLPDPDAVLDGVRPKIRPGQRIAPLPLRDGPDRRHWLADHEEQLHPGKKLADASQELPVSAVGEGDGLEILLVDED